ncbi:nucleoside-diphosphate sugar epimerase [Novosphingobium sp. PC22D]|uniref:NAD(P)H-binding protein n=1 Tax=Novosphingobium sp. PC22D TaxID=1962403 RepID=UPI000BF15BB3|nr:NAD(P)H-binding protein [Novosphingobium sp. PC22D]PEQ13321.1 nucleoside-diphosphate sugar epimerase [Novosphingobium sp. PC22D]
MTQAAARRICLVGATGLVGGRLIARCVGREDVRLVAVARREVSLPVGARMEVLVAEPREWPHAIETARADVLVCALGTTMAKAGSAEAFRSVDHDLVLTTARAAREAGIERMIAISSVGADPASRNFYLRVKGETEAALGKLGFARLDILRPGLLLGPRGERRPLEAAAQIGAPLFDLALHGRSRRFRSMRADALADVVLALSHEKAPGRFVHEYDAMHLVLRRGRG